MILRFNTFLEVVKTHVDASAASRNTKKNTKTYWSLTIEYDLEII